METGKKSIHLFDPFLDQNGSKRIGNFLHSLIQGYNKNLDKRGIIEKAINEYKHQWGNDKVI